MKIRQTIIKSKVSEMVKVQEFLFELKFSWIEANEFKHRHIKEYHMLGSLNSKNPNEYIDIYFLIKNDDTFICLDEKNVNDMKDKDKFEMIEFTKLIRKMKLNKINKT